jgi:protein arginine kinase activator
MKCEECGKNPAVVHLQQTINGRKITQNLCQECAQRKGIPTMLFQPAFSINNLLSALLGSQVSSAPSIESGEEVRCSVCGLSYRDFAKVGRLGCSHCYETFEDKLEAVMRRIHGSDRHVGKIPQKAGGTLGLKRELEKLRKRLNQAVNEEAYEEAARLRDRIKDLEKKLRGEVS